ncbi:A/G-specific adenine glycosylase [Flavobacteriaceae bacterium F08102]|nr:A/G-specific adenine glycosylase [Flavobacteriaceae bacterium F08102]
MNTFSNILITWYLHNKRDLPWRNTTDPYFIWLSEIILQQTRVSQGLPYYYKFIERFPTVYDLSNADIDEVLKLWQGLGYYSRARNMHFTAQFITNELHGKFPDNYADLIKLKGIGDYTASAIASICFNEATAVVDGNVYRVLARYFGIYTPTNSAKGIKDFKALAQSLIDPDNPATFNQAIMEFGATLCKPAQPLCTVCPLHTSCAASQENSIHLLPVKEIKTKVKRRYFNYLIIQNQEEQLLFQQRTNKDIWQGLYEFPLMETPHHANHSTIIQSTYLKELLGENPIDIELFNNTPIKHQLSHQTIFAKFWIITVNLPLENGIKWKSFYNFPVPILIHNFIEKYKLQA